MSTCSVEIEIMSLSFTFSAVPTHVNYYITICPIKSFTLSCTDKLNELHLSLSRVIQKISILLEFFCITPTNNQTVDPDVMMWQVRGMQQFFFSDRC